MLDYTLDPELLISDTAGPAMSVPTEPIAEQIEAASVAYVGTNSVTLAGGAPTAGLVTVTMTYHGGALPAGSVINWQWGDGTSQYGTALVQNHQYTRVGTYMVTATITRPGQPSLRITAPVAVPTMT